LKSDYEDGGGGKEGRKEVRKEGKRRKDMLVVKNKNNMCVGGRR